MSRLANQLKLGYFPTPPSLIDALAAHLSAPGEPFRWLDPCAGEGIALAMLAERLGGETFGIELDGERAALAATRLGHVLPGSYEDARLPHHPGGVSVHYLNPPYAADTDEGGKRLELTFLRDSDDWLMPGGILVYVIPQYRLSPPIARRLAVGYDRLQVFRFPEPEFDAFHQIVVFGVKRKQRREDQDAQLMLLRAQHTPVPVLPRVCAQPYAIPPSNPKAVWYFRPADVPPPMILDDARRGGIFQTRTWRDLVDGPAGMVSNHPAMPLRKGHVAMLALSGALDNCELQQGAERLLIKGRLKKVQVDCSDKADQENGITRLRDRFVSQVVALNLDSGRTQVIAEDELYGWLPQWVEPIARAIVEKFAPRHPMRFDDLTGFTQVVAHHSRFRELPGRKTTGLFAAQKHVVAANLRGLLAPADEATARYLWQCLAASRRPTAKGLAKTLGIGYWQARRRLRRALRGGSYMIDQGEPGTGKTTIGASTAHLLKLLVARRRPFPVVVVCPPHLVRQWPAEIAAIVPMATAVEVRTIRELKAYVAGFQRLEPGTLSIAVVSSERLKRGSGWVPGVVRLRKRLKVVNSRGEPLFAEVQPLIAQYRSTGDPQAVERAQAAWARTGIPLTPRDGESWLQAAERVMAERSRLDVFACPRCGGVVCEKDERGQLTTIPITDYTYFTRHQVKCHHRVTKTVWHERNGRMVCREVEVECGEPLYQLWRGRFSSKPVTDTPAYPLAEFMRRRMPKVIELAIVDELHEAKGQSSDRGQAFGTLVGAAKRALALTGTLYGGLSTTLFYLLHRLDPHFRREFHWREGQRFASLYGVLERIVKDEGASVEEVEAGVFSGVRREFTRVKELPGVSPALVTRLLDHVAFLTLADLGYELPPYTEAPVVLRMEREQQGQYRKIEEALLAAAKEDFSLMSEYLQTTLAYPDACWRPLSTAVGSWRALPTDPIYPKEAWLRDLCRSEAAAGRRVLVYVHYTSTRDIQPRLQQLLKDAGLRVAVLRGVSPAGRAEWLRRRAREGVQVVIANPRLVQTGLNLVMFSTVAYYQIDYSLYLVQQALRRLVRPGQEREVRALIAVYADSMEHRAVYRVKEKLRAAKLLYGDDLVGALVNLGESGASVLEQLVRDVMANTAVPDLAELFRQAGDDARAAGGWLVDAPSETDEVPIARELERTQLGGPASGVQTSLFAPAGVSRPIEPLPTVTRDVSQEQFRL